MSETKHTPGEWIAFRMCGEDGQPLRGAAAAEYVAKCIEAGGDRDFFAVAVAGEGQPDICHTGNGPTSGVNAKLIAAAPDLLRAVNGFRWLGNNLHNIKDSPDAFRDFYEAALQDALAAVAKAEGSR